MVHELPDGPASVHDLHASRPLGLPERSAAAARSATQLALDVAQMNEQASALEACVLDPILKQAIDLRTRLAVFHAALMAGRQA